MILTHENYYSKEADIKFMSVSQYHNFIGSQFSCEAKAMAILKDKWKNEPTTPMLVGSYVDAYFEGTLEKFKEEHPEILTQKGELRAEYKKADEIIKFAESDKFFMTYMSGRKQVIMTGNLFGIDWKIKIDVLHDGKCIVDLKVIKSIKEKIWSNGTFLNFIDAYGYIDQAAIYREIVYLNTGQKLPFFIAALSKEEIPDKEIIKIPDTHMDLALLQIESNLPHVLKLKNLDEPPVRCGKCDYCKTTKVLTSPISYLDL